MSTNLVPSYHGYIGSTKDALIIIQAILDKNLSLIPRRPHERERPDLIKSGNVFVFIEEDSGIKRWTDGIAWSPSRILGRFLVYRELDKNSTHEKEEQKKKRRRKYSVHQDPVDPLPTFSQFQTYNENISNLDNPISQNSLLIKDQGLIKKTLSVTTKNKELSMNKTEGKQTIHLISYYNADDLLNARLRRPSEYDFKNTKISTPLWNAAMESALGGKISIEDEANYFLDTNYQLQNIASLQRNRARSQSDNTPYDSKSTAVLPQSQGKRLPHHVSSYPNILQIQYLREKNNDYNGNTQQGPVRPGSFDSRSNNLYVKNKADNEYNREISHSGELTFVNPFSTVGQNTITYATANPYSSLPHQQYLQHHSHPQQPHQQHSQQPHQFHSQSQIQHLQPHHYNGTQQSFNQLDGNSYSSQQSYLPYPSHLPQSIQPRENINSISDSSDFSITGNSNGSLSSANSNILIGSVSNSLNGTPNFKKAYKNSSNSGNWYIPVNGWYGPQSGQLSELNNTGIEGAVDTQYSQKVQVQGHLNEDSSNFQSYGEQYSTAAPQGN